MEQVPDATEFTDVDASRSGEFFIEFLDARTGIEGERVGKDLVFSLLELEPGMAVIDVGCGAGDDAREIAGLLGPHGRVVGLDASIAMVEESQRRATEGALPIDFIHGDAYDLSYPAGSFDRARADRVFIHLKNPAQALAEMVRIVKPGGRIVVTDVDMGTAWVDSAHRDTTCKVLTSFNDSLGADWVGRSLPRMFHEAGLLDVECVTRMLRANLAFLRRLIGGHVSSPSIAGSFAPGELDEWWQDLASADAAGHFHFGFGVFTTVGRRP